MKTYGIGPGAAADCRAKLDVELDWLDGLLADGRPYLAGDRFSRADLTVASLLSALARPKEMLVYRDMRVPDTLAADMRRWGERPVMRFVRAQYRAHRRPAA
jgi:glutathione S-transferase